MSAEAELKVALEASAVTALVGSKVYPDMVPDKKGMPCIAYQRAATEYYRTIHDGVPFGARVQIQVFCMAESRLQADAVAVAVEQAAGAAGFLCEARSALPPDEDDVGVFATVVDLIFHE